MMQDPTHPSNASHEQGKLSSFLRHVSSLQRGEVSTGILKVQPAQTWLSEAQKRPIPKALFSEFWFEGELCILFADTNLGKSVLAVQLAESISSGEAIVGFRLEAPAQRVLYVDFELSEKQFEARYSFSYTEHYEFSSEFFRAELEVEADLVEGGIEMDHYLYRSLESALERYQVRVLIIDNITYLRSETERSRQALPLMKQLKKWQRKYGISILTLAHTPKRDLSSPLTRNDLQGSKMLINFCDSAFAIGESHQSSRLRYLKQIKARSTEIKYGSDSVCVCELKKARNFLGFECCGQGLEEDHLRRDQSQGLSSRQEEIVSLKASGKSNVAIAEALGVSETAVRKWLKKQEDI